MSNPAGTQGADRAPGGGAGSGSPTDDDMSIALPAAPGIAGGSPTDDDMSVARRPAGASDIVGGSPTDDDMSVARTPDDVNSDETGEAAREAPQPPPGMAASPPGQGLDVDRGALPAGGAAETTTSGREGGGAFNEYPGPQGTLGAMPGSDMAQEPGGTGYVGDDEPIQLPDE